MYKVRSLVSLSIMPRSDRSPYPQIALLFSVFSQLAAFFTIMAVGMWIDRISDGTMNVLVEHIRLYQAAFIVVATVSIQVFGPSVWTYEGFPDHRSVDHIRMVFSFFPHILLTPSDRAGGPSSERSNGLSSSLEYSMHSSSSFGQQCSQAPFIDISSGPGHSSPAFLSLVTCS